MHQASVGKCYIPLHTSPLINYTYVCIGSCIRMFDPIKADDFKTRIKCLFFEVRNTKWYKWNDTRQTGRSCTGWQGMKTNHSFTCQSGSDLSFKHTDSSTATRISHKMTHRCQNFKRHVFTLNSLTLCVENRTRNYIEQKHYFSFTNKLLNFSIVINSRSYKSWNSS